MLVLDVDVDRPDVFRLDGWLLADKFPLVPGFAFVDGFPDRLLAC
jgi:hypothetical protein